MHTIPEIILSGNAWQRGLQHGSALKREINEFLRDNRARINSIRQTPLEDEVILSQVRQHATIIEQQLPEIALELHGLAEGADISYEDAILLQNRVELIAYKEQDILEGDCSTIALQSLGQKIITGQTIDLPGDLVEMGCVFRILPENENVPEILMYGFAGLLGYMGLNSFGLSININMVVSDGWQPGVSPYLLVRQLLTLQSIEACIAEIEKIKLSSSRSLLITDMKRMVNIECTPVEVKITEGDILMHTNHYLHQDLEEKDTMHFLFKNSSIKRLKRLQQMLPSDDCDSTPEMLFNIFADHSLYPVGICAHGEGNLRRSETVGTVVMEPSKHLMHVRKGYACEGETKTFTLTTDANA